MSVKAEAGVLGPPIRMQTEGLSDGRVVAPSRRQAKLHLLVRWISADRLSRLARRVADLHEVIPRRPLAHGSFAPRLHSGSGRRTFTAGLTLTYASGLEVFWRKLSAGNKPQFTTLYVSGETWPLQIGENPRDRLRGREREESTQEIDIGALRERARSSVSDLEDSMRSSSSHVRKAPRRFERETARSGSR